MRIPLILLCSTLFAAEPQHAVPQAKETGIQSRYWKAASGANLRLAQLRNLYTDQMKQIEAERASLIQQMDEARAEMMKSCADAGKTLDENELVCSTAKGGKK